MLYARLREADELGLDVLLVVSPPAADGLGAAVARPGAARRALSPTERALPAATVTSHVRDARPIGLFDSGLGGLTVVRALLDLVPEARHRLLRRHRPLSRTDRSRPTKC